MRLLTCVALAATLATQPVLAAWQSNTSSDSYFVAWTPDEGNHLELNIDCDTDLLGASVALISGDSWDDTAEYPETVDVSFAIDGNEYSSIVFGLQNMDGYIGALAYEIDDPTVMDLINEIGSAVDPIKVTLLGNEFTFTSEGAMSAVVSVLDACGV